MIKREYNNNLRMLKQTIIKQIDEDNILNTEDNEVLRLELKKKNLAISELELKLEEKDLKINNLEKARYEYKVIEQLNNLLNKTKGTEHQEVIILRLQAMYDMNIKVIEHNRKNIN